MTAGPIDREAQSRGRGCGADHPPCRPSRRRWGSYPQPPRLGGTARDGEHLKRLLPPVLRSVDNSDRYEAEVHSALGE